VPAVNIDRAMSEKEQSRDCLRIIGVPFGSDLAAGSS
jgi:hypothetical protein